MPSLQRVSWTQKRANAIVLLLSGRQVGGSSKLKRLLRLLQAHHDPKVVAGSRLSLVVDGTLICVGGFAHLKAVEFKWLIVNLGT